MTRPNRCTITNWRRWVIGVMIYAQFSWCGHAKLLYKFIYAQPPLSLSFHLDVMQSTASSCETDIYLFRATQFLQKKFSLMFFVCFKQQWMNFVWLNLILDCIQVDSASLSTEADNKRSVLFFVSLLWTAQHDKKSIVLRATMYSLLVS